MSSLPKFDALPLWQQHIASAAKSLQQAAGLKPKAYNRFSAVAVRALRPCLPYLIHVTPITSVHILVNRDYKPLGLNICNWVDYGLYPQAHVTETEMKLIIPSFFYHQKCYGIEGTFFNDGCTPWSSKHHAQKLFTRLIGVLADQHNVTAKEIMEAYGLN
jgi:hypothetical protein